jgi:endonuclease/exonuclease/phosphatase family metal-dependent hydrolase
MPLHDIDCVEVLSYFVKSVVEYVCGADCQGNPAFREAQTHEALKVANMVDHATVVCGDWNEDRPELFNTFSQWGFSGSLDGGPNASTWVERNPLTAGFMRADDFCCDHIATKHCRATARHVAMDGPPWASDHLAATATIEL